MKSALLRRRTNQRQKRDGRCSTRCRAESTKGTLSAPQRGSVPKEGDQSSKKWISPQKCGPVHSSRVDPSTPGPSRSLPTRLSTPQRLSQNRHSPRSSRRGNPELIDAAAPDAEGNARTIAKVDLSTPGSVAMVPTRSDPQQRYQRHPTLLANDHRWVHRKKIRL